MKQRTTNTKQFFGHSTAIIMVVFSVLGIVSFADAKPEHCSIYCSTGCYSTLSAANNCGIPLSALRPAVKTIKKTSHAFSYRRLTCKSPTPFVLSVTDGCGCIAVQTAYITPAPHPAANPANFVRAGPEKHFAVSNILSNNREFII